MSVSEDFEKTDAPSDWWFGETEIKRTSFTSS